MRMRLPRPDDRGTRTHQGSGTREPGTAQSERDSAPGQCVFCPGGARPPQQTLNAFVDEYRDRYGVESICRVIQIAPSGYYLHAAKSRQPELRSARAKQDELLSDEIQRVWDDNMQCYGVVKVWKQLKREGIVVRITQVAKPDPALALDLVLELAAVGGEGERHLETVGA